MKAEAPSFEEIKATLITALSPGQYITDRQLDFAPPLFYAISHPFTSQAHTFDFLRFITVIAGALTPVMLYLVGRKLYGETAAKISAYLLLVSPLHIYHSQEFHPPALFALLSLPAFLAMVRAAESNRWKDWLLYDLAAIALLHTQREAMFFVGAFPLIQLSRALFFPPVNDERRVHRLRLVQAILLHHFVIIAVSIPWLWIMNNKLPWDLEVPSLTEVFQIFGQHYLFGMTNWQPVAPWLMTALLIILLLPPILKILNRIDFRTFAAVATLVLAIAVPYIYSQFEAPRFLSHREGHTALPYFVLTLGILLARCNWLIKFGLTSLFLAVFSLSSVHQARTLQRTETTDMLNNIIKDGATKDDILAFWPTFTQPMGQFWSQYYNQDYNATSASDLLKSWADLPPDQNVYFIITQFPGSSLHLHTFQGALTQYSDSRVLWQKDLNAVIKANNLDQRTLGQWYSDPRSLRILDQPTSNTQFIFTAADDVFKKPEKTAQSAWQFADHSVSLSYDSTGHRFVWTTKPTVNLNLPVTLAPGSYTIRLHCSPVFDQPEYGRHAERTVNLTMRSGEDKRQTTISQAEIISLAFTTEVELDRLPLTITTDPMHRVPPPSPGTYGIKIYSISVDQNLPISATAGNSF